MAERLKIRTLTEPEKRIVEARMAERQAAAEAVGAAQQRLARAQSALNDVIAAMVGGHDPNVTLEVDDWTLYHTGDAEKAIADMRDEVAKLFADESENGGGP